MTNEYTPPSVWQWHNDQTGRFANINRPTAGAIFDQTLPRGKHPLQLYSMGTPNGIKVTILLEELLALGIKQAEYDAFLINILEGEQFSSGFVEINPNSKIPAMIDTQPNDQLSEIRVFESASILLYLAKKFNHFLPESLDAQTEVLNWLFWQMGSTPFLGGGFGHFYHYAPTKQAYPIDRFTLEVKRQLDVLNQQLAQNPFIAGQSYSIADMAIFPWYGELVIGELYEAQQFLDVNHYQHVMRWANKMSTRAAVQRGRRVNVIWGDAKLQVKERHCAEDIS